MSVTFRELGHNCKQLGLLAPDLELPLLSDEFQLQNLCPTGSSLWEKVSRFHSKKQPLKISMSYKFWRSGSRRDLLDISNGVNFSL